MRITLISNFYHSKYVWFIRQLFYVHNLRKTLTMLINDLSDSNHSSKLTVWKRKKQIKTEQQANQTHNNLMSILVFVHDSYLLCDYCKYWVGVSRNEYVLLSINMLSTSNLGHKYKVHVIKIITNSYHICIRNYEYDSILLSFLIIITF